MVSLKDYPHSLVEDIASPKSNEWQEMVGQQSV
jgi:hypothetical protein